MRKRRPISAHDPRLRDLLLQGSQSPIEVPVPSLRDARRLRLRLHEFRAALRDHYGAESRDQWEPLYATMVRIYETDSGAIVRIEPRTSELDSILPRATPGAFDDILDDLERVARDDKKHEF